MPIKATKTIKQALIYKPQHVVLFSQTQRLYNAVVGFYFDVIQAHQGVLELSSMDALERLTHATESHPSPVMPLASVAPDLPAMVRRAAINAASGAAKSFYTSCKYEL